MHAVTCAAAPPKNTKNKILVTAKTRGLNTTRGEGSAYTESGLMNTFASECGLY
jgi:hypothetical protein